MKTKYNEIINKDDILTHTEVVDLITIYAKGEIDIDYNRMYDKIVDALIPSSGPADTIFGEALRAQQYLEYRYINDGDVAYKESMNESCDNSMNFLRTLLNEYTQHRSNYAETNYEICGIEDWSTEPYNGSRSKYIRFVRELRECTLWELIIDYPKLLQKGSNKWDSRKSEQCPRCGDSYSISPDYSENMTDEGYAESIAKYIKVAMD